MSVTGIPVVLVDNGVAVTPSNIGTPVTIVGGNAAVLKQGQNVAVRNSAGADSHNATAVVTGGALTGVNLAATVALVDNADALVVPVTGTYATTATFTVAAGVITSIALS